MAVRRLSDTLAPRAGIRLRTALAAALVVGVALVSGAVLLLVLLQRSLAAANADALSTRLAEVRQLVHTEGAGSADLTNGGASDQVLQLRAADGQLVRAVPSGAAGLRLPVPVPPDGGAGGRSAGPVHAGTSFTVLSGWASDGVTGRRLLVVVARDTAGQSELLERLATLLLLGVPLLLVLTGGSTYAFTRQALSPVEAMRREAERISVQRLHGRLPVPPVRDEIGLLARTLNELLDRLEAAQRAQRRFVADAGHELRSPLATLAVTLEMAQQRSVELRQAGLLDEVHRMSRIVEDLLLLARADEHGLRLRRVDVDLDELLQAEVRRARELGGPATQLRWMPARLCGDPDRLARALRNVVDNALRHAASRVELDLRVDQRWATLRVADDGPGIPRADRDRVFERFVRLDEGRARCDGGSGLGLAIVREIVHGHGGQARIGDGPLGGAVVEISLPLGPC